MIVGSRHTLAQRFALGVAERLPSGAKEQVLHAAYDAAEAPRAPYEEQESYYRDMAVVARIFGTPAGVIPR